MDAVVEAHAGLEIPSSFVGQEYSVMRQQMFQQFGGRPPGYGSTEYLCPTTCSRAGDRSVKLGLSICLR